MFNVYSPKRFRSKLELEIRNMNKYVNDERNQHISIFVWLKGAGDGPYSMWLNGVRFAFEYVLN